MKNNNYQLIRSSSGRRSLTKRDSHYNKKKRTFRGGTSAPSSFPLSGHILEAFLKNPPSGLTNKSKRKIAKIYNHFTTPGAVEAAEKPFGYYLDDL